MPVTRFTCPECDREVRPASPLQAGKRVWCPKCSSTITVPAAEEELEEIGQEEPERGPARAAGRGRSRRDEEDEDDRPARRRARDEEPEEDEDRPRERRRKPRKPRKARSGGGGGLRLALLIGGLLVLLVGLGVGGYFLATRLLASPATVRVRALDDATAALAGVKDQATADAARPALLRAGARLREIHEKDKAELEKGLKKLGENPDAVKEAIDEAMRNPEKARAQAEKIEREQRPIKEAMDRLLTEARRVNKVPGGKELLNSFYDAWGEGAATVRLAVGLMGDVENTSGQGQGGVRLPGPGNNVGGAGQPANPGKEKYDKVQVGMTEQQVLDLLGPPAFTRTTSKGRKTLRYPYGFITLEDGKVVRKTG